jgi:selenocysteine-specific elongation factor
VAARTKVQKSLLRKILDELAAQSRIVRLGPGLYIHSETVGELQKRAAEILAEFHQAQPASPGMTAEEFAEALRVDAERAKLLVALLKSRAAIVERVGKLASPEHRETLPEKDQKLAEAIEAAFKAKPFAPPSVEEAAAAAKVPPGDAARAVKMLVEQGRLVEVDKVQGLIFHGEAVARARQLLEEHIRQKGELQSVDFKYVLDTTRKFAIPLLDYFDRIGVTRRQGYTRYLRR